MARAVGGRPPGLRRGPLAADDPRRAGRVPAGASAPVWPPGPRTIGQIWPRESGVLHRVAARTWAPAPPTPSTSTPASPTPSTGSTPAAPQGPGFGLLVREPVGVVGAIIPWNAPLGLISHKVAPALIAGCTVILKSSPEAPGEGYLLAEVAEEIGLPPGVLNVRHRRPRGLRAAGPRPPGRQDHLHRFDGGRPPDRLPLRRADRPLHAGAGRQVGRRDPRRHRPRYHRQAPGPGRVHADRPGVLLAHPDRGLRAPARRAGRGAGRRLLLHPGGQPVRPGVPDGATGGPAGSATGSSDYIEKGVAEGATLATGGGRPAHLDKGWFVEPTVFGERAELLHHRHGRDLRPGGQRDPGQGRDRARWPSPTTPSTG